MERRVRGNSHARCGAGEKLEITSNAYLSLYKTHNEFILSGTLTPDEIDEIVACACGDNFIAEQVGLSHDLPGELNDDDHCWCELYYESNHGFETTDESPTTDLTAQQLLENFRNAKGNWDEVKYAPENIF